MGDLGVLEEAGARDLGITGRGGGGGGGGGGGIPRGV